jgi:hypothetical protein
MEEHPTYELQLVGHSLGGAVAALAALEMEETNITIGSVTTFGEPRIGNEALARYVDLLLGDGRKYRRVTHLGDQVPLLPPGGEGWGYASHGSELFIRKATLPVDVGDIISCQGRQDPDCIASLGDGWREPWDWSRTPLPLFAHRDYFHRLGLCVPGGDPGGEWG